MVWKLERRKPGAKSGADDDDEDDTKCCLPGQGGWVLNITRRVDVAIEAEPYKQWKATVVPVRASGRRLQAACVHAVC